MFFCASVVCGCYIIYSTNEEAYLAVMKKVPTLGCVWVWAVVEMRLVVGVASLGVDALFMWWMGMGLMQ